MKRMLMKRSMGKMAGLTLLETMFGVAIGALILIAAVIFYTSTKNSQNVSKTVTDMNSIVAQTSAYIAPGATALSALTAASTDTVAVLQSANYLPADMSDPWGQAYTAVTTAPATGTAYVTITVTGLGAPADDKNCAAIQQAVSATSIGMGDGCSFKYNV